MDKIHVVHSITLIGIFIWIIAILAAPYLKSQSSVYGSFIYAVFSPTCHQIPSRCLSLFGNPLAVCTRCFGIYLGFFLGTCVFPVFQKFSSVSLPKTKTLVLFSLPIVIDTAGNVMSVWFSPHWVRLATGVIWGAILPFYFIPGIADVFKRRDSQRKIQ